MNVTVKGELFFDYDDGDDQDLAVTNEDGDYRLTEYQKDDGHSPGHGLVAW